MNKIKKIIATALVLSTAFTVIGCSTTIGGNKASKTVLAEVNGKTITLGDIDKEISTLIKTLQDEHGKDFETKIDEETKAYFNNERATVLKQIVQENVLLKKAEELKLMPTEEELNKKIDENIKELSEYYGGDEELEKAKEYYGHTDESFRMFVKNQVIQETVVEEVTKDIKVSDEEIKKFYEDNIDTYFTQGIGANAKHILFEKEEDAKKLKADIDAKKTTFKDAFEKNKNNKSENKKPIAEDLGFVTYDQENLDKDFLKGFKAVKEGAVSTPVKSSFGYHIIEATGVTTEPVITPLKDAKEAIIAQLEFEKKSEKFKNQLIEWQEEMNVKFTASSIGLESEN